MRSTTSHKTGFKLHIALFLMAAVCTQQAMAGFYDNNPAESGQTAKQQETPDTSELTLRFQQQREELMAQRKAQLHAIGKDQVWEKKQENQKNNGWVYDGQNDQKQGQ